MAAEAVTLQSLDAPPASEELIGWSKKEELLPTNKVNITFARELQVGFRK